jgi:glucan phosphorylase
LWKERRNNICGKNGEITKERSFVLKQKNQELKSILDQDIQSKLHDMKAHLKQEETEKAKKQKEEAIKRKQEAEKNKSFKELLNESNLKWKNFKS